MFLAFRTVSAIHVKGMKVAAEEANYTTKPCCNLQEAWDKNVMDRVEVKKAKLAATVAEKKGLLDEKRRREEEEV